MQEQKKELEKDIRQEYGLIKRNKPWNLRQLEKKHTRYMEKSKNLLKKLSLSEN